MKRYGRLFSALIISIAMTAVVHGQIQDNSLTEKYIEIKLNGGSVWEAVHNLSRAGVPIGFEARADLNVDSDPRVSLQDGKVGDILNSLVSQDPSYTWEINDGVVNIFPIKGRSELVASFLKTTIGPIRVSPGDKRISILSQIEDSSGFKAFHENWVGSKVLVFQSAVLGIENTVSKELNISSADARTVLNRITSSEIGGKIWIISVSSRNSNTILISY